MTTPAAPASRTVLHGRVVTPDAVIDDGAVVVDGDRIAWVGAVDAVPAGMLSGSPPGDGDEAPLDVVGRGPASPAARGRRPTLLPGLVDLHCHGGGGASFPDAAGPGAAETARRAAGEHLAHGTTSVVASLVTAPPAVLLERVALLADLAEAGEVAGIHLEGPFLSPARRGAHDARALAAGDGVLVRDLARAGRGHLVTMTVAPEVAGVLGRAGALEVLCEVGVVPSVGHTDASAEVVEQALARASRLLARADTGPGRPPRSLRPTVTHLFNGMRPLHHRDPGPVAACLAAAGRGQAVLELVADGVHLAPATVRSVMDLVGADAVALVSDAMAATGMPDGRYGLGGVDVDVRDGVARLRDGGAIAGSTAHLLDVVRSAVRAGVPLVPAVRAASATPAGVLGRGDLGGLVAGRRADVVEVDDDLRPCRVMRAGTWVAGQDEVL